MGGPRAAEASQPTGHAHEVSSSPRSLSTNAAPIGSPEHNKTGRDRSLWTEPTGGLHPSSYPQAKGPSSRPAPFPNLATARRVKSRQDRCRCECDASAQKGEVPLARRQCACGVPTCTSSSRAQTHRYLLGRGRGTCSFPSGYLRYLSLTSQQGTWELGTWSTAPGPDRASPQRELVPALARPCPLLPLTLSSTLSPCPFPSSVPGSFNGFFFFLFLLCHSGAGEGCGKAHTSSYTSQSQPLGLLGGLVPPGDVMARL